jgi:DNA-binding HxlR family transcriptional regulator
MVKVKEKQAEPTQINHSSPECLKTILPVKDALEVLNGKWKLQIIISLTFGTKRFRQIAKEIPGITDKMLSKELKELEVNQLVKRAVIDSLQMG